MAESKGRDLSQGFPQVCNSAQPTFVYQLGMFFFNDWTVINEIAKRLQIDLSNLPLASDYF